MTAELNPYSGSAARPMTEAELEEIRDRARLAKAVWGDVWDRPNTTPETHKDRAVLLSEVDLLRQERGRLLGLLGEANSLLLDLPVEWERRCEIRNMSARIDAARGRTQGAEPTAGEGKG